MAYEDYVHTDRAPAGDELVCRFRLGVEEGIGLEWAAGAVAAESSIGTWDPTLATMRDEIRELGATVTAIEETEPGSEAAAAGAARAATIRVAYPPELFEPGSLPQIQSSVTGNVYGLSELTNLRIEGLDVPEGLRASFAGPQLGLGAVKARVGAEDRPVVGTIVKPKLGLEPDEHAAVAEASWRGGLDVVKDDENLTDMAFSGFEDRVRATLAAKRDAEDATGEAKLYFPNVTAPCDAMLERIDAVIDAGGGYVMIDVLTAGWGAVQAARDHLAGTGVGIHAHRAQHAAYTRPPHHGIAMLVVAVFARLAGVDNLHAGSVVGKMEGERDEVERIYDFLRRDWGDVAPVIPVASGGLHPGLVPDVVEILGTDLVVQAGGGVHGHPDGTEAGARAFRAAADAAATHEDLAAAAEREPALAAALDEWGRSR